MYLIQTVQTSWRPQLPLPKEVVPPTTSADHSTRSSEMNRQNSAANHSSSNRKDTYQSAPQISSGGNKKWSFGRLFRKKKEAETESSSEEDRKAGFIVSPKYRKKDKKKRGSKLIGSGFDHIVVSPTRDNEFFLPFEPVPAVETTHLSPPVEYEPHSRSTNSLDRRSKRDRKKTGAKDAQRHSSSEEEMVSLNSSTTFTRYRSDESLGSGGPGGNGNGGQSRRSRAARNERYYKRLSRDGEVSHGQAPVMQAPQPAQRWQTQPVPLSIYSGHISQNSPPTGQKAHPQYAPSVVQDGKIRNSTSLSHVAPHVPIAYGMSQPPKNLQNTVNDGKRSISYDSHIHLQNVKKPLPPPPPPRDPLRRVNVTGHSDHRPISYAFDHSSSHAPTYSGMSGRCVSDDRIWSGTAPTYQSASSINNPPASIASSQNRRFITRAERDAHPTKKSLPSGLDYRYVAEAAPRSRKPIHLFNQDEDKPVKPPSPVIIRTTKSGLPGPVPSNQSNSQLSSEYWRRGRDHHPRPESAFNKPRSVSSSRAGELRSYNIPMYSEVSKPKSKHVPADEVAHVVSGSLLIKPSKDNNTNYVEIRNNANKSNSMPNHYQRRDLGGHRAPKADSPTPNKYDEYVAEKRVRNILEQPLKVAPNPPQRKVVTKPLTLPPEPDVIMRKKPTNLEDAINELEAIYKSLKLGDESLLDRAERRDIPTPTNFEKYAELHTEEFLDDDDEPVGEPDLVRDDFAYRNIKHANLAIKSSEKQPPFGIPIGPVVPSPRTDYLHVTPEKDSQKVRTAPFKYPDIVCDDLAVRTLRKDPPGQVKPQFSYSAGSLKKKRAIRTQSANIYTLIQRNAAKPSGGDLHDYLELAKTLERAGSMSDIHKETEDIPSTLQLLRNLREQDQVNPKVLPFRHPSQGGAICDLPTVLSKFEEQETSKPPIPLPRKSLSPDPEKTKMEDALNKIAREAKESSEKLTRELMELRKEALITSSRPKVSKPSIERDLEQIEAVSEAAKRCRHILMDTIPPNTEEDQETRQTPPRRLATEDKLIKAIDQVSDAANKVCEKILNEIVTVQPPVIVQNAIEVKNRPKQELVMPSLIQKLDPSSARIGEIAERCMRQISQLNDLPDYDNVQVTACNTTKNDTDREKRSDADILIVPGSVQVTAVENEEEIDKIMKECEEQARGEVSASSKSDDATDVYVSVGDKTVNTTSASSSSDCLKSSSPSAGPHLSSSITSFNPYSSSDYIKSPSSEFHAPSTDPIKTFSTTSYDVQSSSVTPNITNSSFSYTPSPPLNLTPVCSSGGEKGERSGSASQYNSSEELAMIFGIEKSSPATTTTGKEDEDEVVVDCTVPSPVGVLCCSEPNKPDVQPNSIATTTTATNPEFCESVLVCKLDTIDEDREDLSPRQVSRLYLPSYASNISIIVTGAVNNDDGGRESPRADSSRQFDSLSSIDDSSNPDSGNVSLSDFPVQSPVNASLKVELAHNSRFEIAKNFVNEITIDEGSSNVDYLRTLFAQDELSTSFSIDETDEDYQVNTKDQHSPGQLLHEVLSQVSRINAGTNRKQLISQLENISECTKIVEDLSDRLSHQASRLKSKDDITGGKPRGIYRVRFSEDCDNDHEEDQSACLKSLQVFGHHLSSSEESIPPMGEIFNVPLTDSENEDQDHETKDADSDPPQNLNFEERQKSFEEECLMLKKALHKVVQSGLIGFNSEEETDLSQTECSTHEPKIVSVIEVVDSGLKDPFDDPQLKIFLSEDKPLTLSSEVVSIIEVLEPGSKNRMDDPHLKALLTEPLKHSSEVISIVKVVNPCPKSLHYEALEGISDTIVELEPCKPGFASSSEAEEGSDEVVHDSWALTRVSDTSRQSEDSSGEQIKWSLQSESYKAPSQVTEVILVDSDDELPSYDPNCRSRSGKAYLSPVNISLKIVNQVSKVSFVDCTDETIELSSLVTDDAWSQNAGGKTIDSEKESYSQLETKLARMSVVTPTQARSLKLALVDSDVFACEDSALVDLDVSTSEYEHVGKVNQASEMITVEAEQESCSNFVTSLDRESKAQSQPPKMVAVNSNVLTSEVQRNNMEQGSLSNFESAFDQVPDVKCDKATTQVLSQASEMSLADSNVLIISEMGPTEMQSFDNGLQVIDQVSTTVIVDSEVLPTSKLLPDSELKTEGKNCDKDHQASDIVFVDSEPNLNPSDSYVLVSEANSSKVTVATNTFGSQESIDIIYEAPMSCQEQTYAHNVPLENPNSKPSASKCSSGHHQSPSEGSIEFNHQNCDHRPEPSASRADENQNQLALLRYRPSSSPAGISSSQVPTTSTVSKTLSILAQPRHDDRMTTLEHILLACTLGVVTGNDFITMLAIIIGVLTIIAIVLL